MKRPVFYTALLTVVAFMFCTNSSSLKTNDASITRYSQLNKATWLIGKWQNVSTEGALQEIWEKKNDSIFIGSSFFIVGIDTVTSESINLEERGNELFYMPTVKNQNGGKSIIFKLSSISNNQLVFENPKHDYPQKIVYKQISNDSLVAVISGIVNGIEKSQKFPMTRAQ